MPLREKRYFKEVGWLLLIKLCLLVVIRIIFFSHPEGKQDGAAYTSAHLFGVHAPLTSPPPSENRSSYDQ
jgi:hypothetical protein